MLSAAKKTPIRVRNDVVLEHQDDVEEPVMSVEGGRRQLAGQQQSDPVVDGDPSADLAGVRWM